MAKMPEIHAAILEPPCSVTVITGDGAFMHCHNFPQIWYVRRGELLHTVGSETVSVAEGSCIFIPSYCPHGTEKASADSEVVSISFSDELFSAVRDDVLLLGENPYSFGHRIEFFSQFEGAEKNEISELISAIEAECAKPRGGSASKLVSLFLRLFRKISSEREAKKLTQKERRRITEITEVVSFVAEEIADKATIGEICEAMKISEASFIRNFKKVTGMTFAQMLLSMRVRYSCMQLVRTEKKMIQIAGEAGFYDEAHFSHAFSDSMGVSPTQYRAEKKTLFDDICIICDESEKKLKLTAKRTPRRKKKLEPDAKSDLH